MLEEFAHQHGAGRVGLLLEPHLHGIVGGFEDELAIRGAGSSRLSKVSSKGRKRKRPEAWAFTCSGRARQPIALAPRIA